MNKLLKGIFYAGIIILALIMLINIFPDIKSLIPNSNLPNIFPSPTSIVIPTEVVPTIDIKFIKSQCIDQTYKNLATQYGNQQKQNNEWIFIINSQYRICLAKNGLTPEDLLSTEGSSQNNNSINNNAVQQNQPESNQVNYIEPTQVDYIQQNKLQQQQQCQDDINKYNICMNEYNLKLSEYNTCLNEARPFHNCLKPFNICFKPGCAY
jgi:hypothetical protein